MEKERRVKWLVIVSLIVAVLGLTIAFAALSETLTINGTATLDAAKWGIKFENLTSETKTGDAIVNNEATIASDKVTIENIDVTLKTPGDSVTYKVDLVNEGTINAEISNIKVPELTEEQKRYIDFKVTYDNGEEVTQGDILNSETTKNLTIKIEFKKDITASDLPSNAQQINLSYKLDFVQTDEKETTEGTETTDDYENKVISWDLSDTVKMTYYDGELQTDGTYDNGTLVISGEGSIPDAIIGNDGIPTNIPILLKLADVSSFSEVQPDENGTPILKYNPTNLVIEEGVTDIGTFSFYLISTLNDVTLPSTINKISDYAFGCCTSLKNINLTNITEIGDYAFIQCTSLVNINLSKTTVIGEQAFGYCTSLESIEMSNVITIGNSAFLRCSSLKSVVMPNVNTISEWAFRYCTSLSSVNMSKVTTIGAYAFSDCKALKEIDLPNIINIGELAFSNCTSLTTVNVSNSISSLGVSAFNNMATDSIIYVPDEITKNKFKSYNYYQSKTTIVVDPTKFE